MDEDARAVDGWCGGEEVGGGGEVFVGAGEDGAVQGGGGEVGGVREGGVDLVGGDVILRGHVDDFLVIMVEFFVYDGIWKKK